jgi:hypothetical protein
MSDPFPRISSRATQEGQDALDGQAERHLHSYHGGVILAAGFIAWWQASETRRLRKARIRPFVVVDFDAFSEAPLIYLVISNLGSTLARNVQFEFRQPIASSMDDLDSKYSISNLSIFTKGIPSLPPGKTIPLLFDSAIERYNSDLPDCYDVRISYEGGGEKGWLGARKMASYEDWMILDLGIYFNTLRVERHGLHDIHERLKEISGEMKKWSASGRGLLVLDPADIREQEERLMQMRAESAPPPTSGKTSTDS